MVTGQNTGLARLQLKPAYRSDADDLVGDFYDPCLSRSTHYRRAVGYFTSRGLAAAQGLAAFKHGNVCMQLIASPLLDANGICSSWTNSTTR